MRAELRGHLADHKVLFGLGALWLVAVLLFPTLPIPEPTDSALTLPPITGGPLASPGPGLAVMPDGSVAAPVPAAEVAEDGSGTFEGGQGLAIAAGPPAIDTDGTPLTRNGARCTTGVLQVAHASYSPPCVPAFSGDNGGATARGVTATEIRLVSRFFEDNPFAGPPPSAETMDVVNVFVQHLNDTVELYGRRVVIDFVASAAGDPLQEQQGRGRDGACQDAAEYAQERKAFGVVQSASTPFLDCAAEQQLVVFESEGRQSERLMTRRHPYLWTSQRGCERVGDQVVEYIGKRLVDRPAAHAGNGVRGKPRKIGFYVPDNETYQPCIAEASSTLERRYGHRAERFEYTPDSARLADQASLAVARFKSAGVTTVVLTCDDLSIPLLMSSADLQGWQPEWILSGIGSQGVDEVTRSWPAAQAAHVFGVSEYPVDTTYFAPDTEPANVYRSLTGKVLDPTYYGVWAQLQQVFRLLQAAGPDLTPAAIGQGALSLPDATGYQGRWSYRVGPTGVPGQPSHGATVDATEIFWDPAAPSIDGQAGAFRPVARGARFASGEWPTTDALRG